MEYIYYLVLLLVILINFRDIRKRPFTPANITIIVWTVVTILYKLQSSLNPLTDQFYTCCILWILGFVISSKIVSRNIVDLGEYTYSDKINKKILYLYYVIIIIGLPLYSSAYLNAVGGFSFDALADIRNNAVNGDVHLGYLSFVPALCKSLLLIELYLYNPKRLLNIIFAVVANIIPAIVIMEKGYLAFIFISVMFFFYQKNYIKSRTVLVSVLGFFALMFVFNGLRSMTVGESNIQDFAALYCASPSVAFCSLVPGQASQFGEHTFRFFYALLHSIGIGPGAASNWYEPVFVPIRTNVFTIMEPYFYDFGTLGVLIFGIIDGVICGKLYNHFVKRQTIVVSCIYAYVMYMLVFQFFQEWLFISLSVTLQITICIYIASLKFRK